MTVEQAHGRKVVELAITTRVHAFAPGIVHLSHEIDGQRIHFLHVRSPEPEALPEDPEAYFQRGLLLRTEGEVLAALAADGLSIVDVRTRDPDLEDVFLSLVSSQKAA